MKNFKQLRIWQKGFEIAVKTYALADTFPKTERFGLCKQIIKSAISIVSNIAEGSGRQTEKEYSRFIDIAIGSSFELETQLLISQHIKHGNDQLRTEILADL